MRRSCTALKESSPKSTASRLASRCRPTPWPIFNVRRAYVRNLLGDPIFRQEMASALAAKRLAYMPEALDRVASIMRNGEDPVALRASETILGETAKGPGVTVNVSQTNVAAIRPGYVIRLPAETAQIAPSTQQTD